MAGVYSPKLTEHNSVLLENGDSDLSVEATVDGFVGVFK